MTRLLAKALTLGVLGLAFVSGGVAWAVESAPAPVGSAVAPLGSAPAPATSAEAAPPTTSETTMLLKEDEESEKDLNSIPLGKGLPVVVQIALMVTEVKYFDDVKGEFEATTDLRLSWRDPRLRFPTRQVIPEYREFRAADAEERLSHLWQPNVQIENLVENSGYEGKRLRIYSNGVVETIARKTGRYTTAVSVKKFPFDRQALRFEFVVRDQTTDDVLLDFQQDDEQFSRPAPNVKVAGWKLGDVALASGLLPGWNGDRYSTMTAGLVLDREPNTGMTTIFIPLFASLLIPLLALWMNKPQLDGFELPAFELANMGIGGLFSVIALSFAVSSSYPMIAGSDNTVTQLFALNYATLAIALSIMVAFFRFNLVKRLTTSHVQIEVFRFLMWSLPLLTLGTSFAFVLVAAV